MLITRDAINELPRNGYGYVVEFDKPQGGGGILDILFVDERGNGFAESRRTGQIYGFTPVTGKTVAGTVRVHVGAAEDTGDMAGTLDFSAETMRGRIAPSLIKV